MIRGRLRRLAGFVALSVRRLYVRGTRTATRRTAATILGVAVAIALLVTATGLAVGLATQTTIYGDDVDYWIVPEGGGETSALVAVEGPQFGEAHETTARIESIDGVAYATPVLSAVRYASGSESDAHILFVGIVPREEMGAIGGVSADGLSVTPDVSNPDREWRGEVALSASAATQLGANTDQGRTVEVDGYTFHVTNIEEQRAAADMPIALVHLSDLQQLTGAGTYDTADQYLVSTTDPQVRSELEALHPQSSVNTRADLTATQIVETEAALAIALGAFIITLVVGSLFVVMAAGLELTNDAKTIAALSAIGVSGRSQMMLAGTQTVFVTVIGGLFGAVLGLGGLYLINTIVSETVLSIPIASTHLGLVLYGIAAAVCIGLVSLPYVRYLIGRIGPQKVMR